MKFVPDSVLDYALMMRWEGKDGVFFIGDFDICNEKFIYKEDNIKVFDSLLKKYDAIVIFEQYIACYIDKSCCLWDYEVNIIIRRDGYDEIFPIKDDSNLVYITQNGKEGLYSISDAAFIVPIDRYDKFMMYESTIKVKDGDLYGLIDFYGDEILLAEYQDISAENSSGEDFIFHMAKKDNLWFLFDENGNLLTTKGYRLYSTAFYRAQAIIEERNQ